MANRYCNFTGNQKIKDTYDLIPKGFDKVQSDMDMNQKQINQLVVSGDSSPEAAQARVGATGITYASLKTRLDAEYNLQVSKSDITPEQRRMIFRGKNLGNVLTTSQKTAIQNGSFDDLFLGDYWVIGGRNWRIVDFNYWHRCGDTSFNKHHLVIMPDSPLYNAQMNDTNTTVGGYVGSLMYTANLENAKTIIDSAFGSAVLTHREFLINTVTNGYPSAGAWFDSTVELPNEIMIYGSLIHTPAGDGSIIVNCYTISKQQLALFSVAPKFVNIRASYWLRDVVSSSNFASMRYHGIAAYDNASGSIGVRPVFLVG